jgi:hypothetical protein
LYLPALCLVEARKVIISRYSHDTEAIRQFVGWATKGVWDDPDRDIVIKNLKDFEKQAQREIEELGSPDRAPFRSRP